MKHDMSWAKHYVVLPRRLPKFITDRYILAVVVMLGIILCFVYKWGLLRFWNIAMIVKFMN